MPVAPSAPLLFAINVILMRASVIAKLSSLIKIFQCWQNKNWIIVTISISIFSLKGFVDQ
jgi:hypothetical protein